MKHPLFSAILKKTGVVTSIGMLSVLSVSAAQAVVTLEVDDNIKVTAINGTAVNTSMFKPIERAFELTPGQHVITAQYDRLYDLRSDDHDYLHSGNVTVVAALEDNQTYHLAMPGQPERYKEAKEYAKHPTLAIMQGNQIVAQATDMTEKQGIFSNIKNLFGNGDAQQKNTQAIAAIQANPNTVDTINSTQTMATDNVIPAIAPAVYSAPTGVATPMKPASAAINTNTNRLAVMPTANAANSNATTLDQFMQIWLQATPAERAKIRQWVQQ